jgi:hypothetical protein
MTRTYTATTELELLDGRLLDGAAVVADTMAALPVLVRGWCVVVVCSGGTHDGARCAGAIIE